jgi:hypothetical protein
MLSPFKTQWGTYLIQGWFPGFDPKNLVDLAFPTWVTLRNLLVEYLEDVKQIAERLGDLVGTDSRNEYAKPSHLVTIDYGFLPLRCRACYKWDHHVLDYEKANWRPSRPTRR